MSYILWLRWRTIEYRIDWDNPIILVSDSVREYLRQFEPPSVVAEPTGRVR